MVRQGQSKMVLVDCIQTTVRTMEIEELRKKSLKRKKVKKEEKEKLFRLSFQQDRLEVEELDVDSELKTEHRLSETSLPLAAIADVCASSANNLDSLWGVTYDGFLFTLELK
jgi:hypothetical protein